MKVIKTVLIIACLQSFSSFAKTTKEGSVHTTRTCAFEGTHTCVVADGK